MKTKYQLLINQRESVHLKHCNDFKAFIKYLSNREDVYENISEYSPNKKAKH